jgi:hypothetical protein
MSSSDSASSADAKTKDVPSESDDDAAAGSSDGESDAASGSDSDAAAGSSDGESDAASGSVSKCELCEQLYGQVDKDNPKQGTGFDAVVTEARNGGQECTSCFYNRRGSFKKLTLKLAIKYYATNMNFRGKFATNRRLAHRHRVQTKKGKKTQFKYEKVDFKLLIRKVKETYVDMFVDSEWKGLEQVCREAWPDSVFKNNEARIKKVKKKWPKASITYNDKKQPGVVIEDDATKTFVRRGVRVAARTEQEKRVESKDDLEEAEEKITDSQKMVGIASEDYRKAKVKASGSDSEGEAASSGESNALVGRKKARFRLPKGCGGALPLKKSRVSNGSKTVSSQDLIDTEMVQQEALAKRKEAALGDLNAQLLPLSGDALWNHAPHRERDFQRMIGKAMVLCNEVDSPFQFEQRISTAGCKI